MRWLAGVRRRLAGAWVPVGAVGLIAYFAFHAVQGDHGLLARFRLEAEAAQARATLAGLTEQRAWLQRRADLLNHQHLDLDMLEEQVRTMMNYVHPDDVILYLDPPAGADGP